MEMSTTHPVAPVKSSNRSERQGRSLGVRIVMQRNLRSDNQAAVTATTLRLFADLNGRAASPRGSANCAGRRQHTSFWLFGLRYAPGLVRPPRPACGSYTNIRTSFTGSGSKPLPARLPRQLSPLSDRAWRCRMAGSNPTRITELDAELLRLRRRAARQKQAIATRPDAWQHCRVP